MGAAAGVPRRPASPTCATRRARGSRATSTSARRDRVPRYLVQLQPDQKYALVVDTAKSTLYVFENHNGSARYLADYYISSGKNGIDKLREGDKKTPLGVYHVTSSMPREKLADFYGVGAFPINYPNEWDRREGRDGSRHLAARHAVRHLQPPAARERRLRRAHQPRPRRDPPAACRSGSRRSSSRAASSGCSRRRSRACGRSSPAALESWRSDWESLDTERYLRHYSPAFTSGGAGLSGPSRSRSAR